MKKIIIALLLITLTLCSCGKSEPVSDTTVTASGETVSETEQTTEETAKETAPLIIIPEKTPQKTPSGFGNFSVPDSSESTTAKLFETTGSAPSSDLTTGDISLLEEFYPAMGMTGYNAYSETAVSDAYGIILSIFGIYSNYFPYVDMINAADPLNKYPVESFVKGHYAYPADNVDWILLNVFNVEPDHEAYYSTDDGSVWLYYYDGFYYTEAFIYGLDYNMVWRLNSYTNISKNKYQLKMDVYHVIDDEETLYGQMDVTARLKTVNGSKVWSFTKINLVSGKGTEY